MDRPTRGSRSDAGEEQSHLTSMVTPDIHGCVRLDLVTGPPEKKYHPLGSGSSCCWIAWSHPLGSFFNDAVGDAIGANPCSSPCWTTPWLPLVVCSYFVEQKSSSCEELKGWSWLPFHRCTHEPREVVSSDRPRGGSPPQRIHLSSAMTKQGMRV